MRKQCVGIDVSMEDVSVRICHRDEEDTLDFSDSHGFINNKKGYHELFKWSKGYCDDSVEVVYLMEATGVYHESLAYFLHQKGATVHVVLANTSKNYSASLNMKTKTDDMDSLLLSRFGVARKHREWVPPSEFFRSLRQLTRYKIQLQEQKTALKNILHSKKRAHSCHPFVKRSNTSSIRMLDKQLEKCKVEIEKHLNSKEEVFEKVRKACTIKGFALQSIAIIIAETDGFSNFNNARQLTAYAGLDVVHTESGTSVRGKSRMSKKGNKYIRHALYHPAMSASQRNPQMSNIYKRLISRKSSKMVGQVAVQRKMLLLLFSLWKSGMEYDPNYGQKK